MKRNIKKKRRRKAQNDTDECACLIHKMVLGDFSVFLVTSDFSILLDMPDGRINEVTFVVARRFRSAHHSDV